LHGVHVDLRLAYACPACSARLCRYCRKDGATNQCAVSWADSPPPVASWGIAFVEYCFAVPANRWGHAVYSAGVFKGPLPS
jgi:hypothetical protein